MELVLMLVILGETYLIIKGMLKRKETYAKMVEKAKKEASRKIKLREAQKRYYQKHKEKLRKRNRDNYFLRKNRGK